MADWVYIDVGVPVMRTTEKALLCLRNFNCEQFWVPRSQLRSECRLQRAGD
jgi:hypothetical protein